MLLKACPALPASADPAATTVVTAAQAPLAPVVVTAARKGRVPQLLQPRHNLPHSLNSNFPPDRDLWPFFQAE